MPFNEFLIQEKSDTYTLSSGDKKLDFSGLSDEELGGQVDRADYARFRALAGAVGDQGTKQVRSLFVKVDRMRLGLLDSILFYPIVLVSFIELTNFYYLSSYETLGNQTLIQWYPTFWNSLFEASKEFIANNYANAFILFGVFDCLFTVIISMTVYNILKFLTSWIPSLSWRIIFKLLGKKK